MKIHQLVACGLFILLTSACARYERGARLDDVNNAVMARTETSLPAQFSGMSKPVTGAFTPNEAMQLALKNNLNLQASLEDLNVATAQEVQAGLLINPALSGEILFTGDGARPALDFGLAFQIGQWLTRGRRMKLANAERQRIEAMIVESVIGTMADAKAATVTLWARQQSLEILRDVKVARQSAAAAAQILYDAGNLTAGDLAKYKRMAVQSQLTLGLAQIAMLTDVENLSNVTGVLVVDGATAMVAEAKAPPIEAVDVFIKTTISKSLMLEAERERIRALGIQVGLADVSVWLDHLEVEAALEREDDTLAGFGATLSLPIFDTGNARSGAAKAAFEAASLRYKAMAFSVANRARAILGLQGILEAASSQFSLQLIEQADQEFDFDTRQLNAMQLGPLRLIDSRVQQLENSLTAIDVRRMSVLANIQAEALLRGVSMNIINDAQGAAIGDMQNEGGH